ncbi:acetylxylan esterase [Paenibacillus thalictri]|uniref:Cephalosporin deacetylase n=1 Tax=Paenibacillus thalictri TaxID=2527873 RepID=A0A4Q9DXD9_9BACL|nr:acetylxylan esterase [Paenibacillus thalictri]TBL81787.1 cephalosporin deacetylase [Paenibacillus thalictri]
MPMVDWPLPKLREYRPDSTAEADFDVFWQKQKELSAQTPLNPQLKELDYPVKVATVYEVTYDGADGTPVHGWYVVPKHAAAPMPAMVRYHGYSGSRGFVYELLHYAAMGIAVLSIDTRGQGNLTPDLAVYPQGSAAGWLTLGITDPDRYYYKQVYLDCIRAIDFICGRPEVDAARIAVYGASQGGALTLAVAGLDSRPKLAMPVYPFLCDFRRSVEIHSTGPYPEIKNWFRRFDPEHLQEEQVYRTLSYFDGMNHASRIKARTLMAITLQDTTCPPSTCFAAYNHVSAEKELKLYHDYGHEPLHFHEEAMMRFVETYL